MASPGEALPRFDEDGVILRRLPQLSLIPLSGARAEHWHREGEEPRPSPELASRGTDHLRLRQLVRPGEAIPELGPFAIYLCQRPSGRLDFA